MFTQNCFIRKNSKELAKELQSLGYHTYNVEEYDDDPSDWCTVTEIEADYAGIRNNEPRGEFAKKCIDCGTNEQLFISIAALRNDSDKNQWFVHKSKSHWWLCTDFDNFKEDYELSNEDNELKFDDWHKATVEELIEHFKDK